MSKQPETPAAAAAPERDRRDTSARLAAVLASAASGTFPPADGGVTILRQPSDRDAGVIAFTAHAVVFADEDPAWIAAQLPPGDLSGPLSASFLQSLGERLGRRSFSVDMLACASALAGPAPEGVALTELTGSAGQRHPRVTSW